MLVVNFQPPFWALYVELNVYEPPVSGLPAGICVGFNIERISTIGDPTVAGSIDVCAVSPVVAGVVITVIEVVAAIVVY